MMPIQTILHPTDFSTTSERAFHLACSLARDHGARMILVHVLTPPIAAFEGVAVPMNIEAEQQAVEERLPQIARMAEERGVHVEEQLIEAGDPAREIVRIATDTPCDLIVMGTQGRTGLERLLMGSVAEKVLRKAPCPVLTVKSGPARVPEPEFASHQAEWAPAI